MENNSTWREESSSSSRGPLIGCPSWCTEHPDAGHQRPGVSETWHTTTAGTLLMDCPTGGMEARPVSVEVHVLVTDDLLEGTSALGEASATVLVHEPTTEALVLGSAAECRQLAAWLMQAADDLDEVLRRRLVPPSPRLSKYERAGETPEAA